MVALSNHKGGWLFLGVDDDGSLVGLRGQNYEERIMKNIYIKRFTTMTASEIQKETAAEDQNILWFLGSRGAPVGNAPEVPRDDHLEDLVVTMKPGKYRDRLLERNTPDVAKKWFSPIVPKNRWI